MNIVRPYYYQGETESGRKLEGCVFALDFSHAIMMIDTGGEFVPTLNVRPATVEEAERYVKR